MASHAKLEKNDGSTDQRVILSNVSWGQYEMMLAWRGDVSVPRYAYLDSDLEIMSPSQSHEDISQWVARIIEAYAIETDIQISPVGSWTLRNAPHGRGIEPDQCYFIGDRNKSRPDLAIEVILTSGGLDRLEIYRGLEVPEVWFIRGGVIQTHALRNNGYEPTTSSVAFPKLDLSLVMQLLNEPMINQAVRKMQAWARGHGG